MSRKLYQKPDLKGRRQARASCVLKRSLSSMLLRRFPSMSITVSNVILSADFQHAKVFVVSMTGGSEIISVLEESSQNLKQDLKRAVKFPAVPHLQFIWDGSFDAACRMNLLIDADG